jgi:hypothetical protein
MMQKAALLNNYGASSLLARRRAAVPGHSVTKQDETMIFECFSSSMKTVKQALAQLPRGCDQKRQMSSCCDWNVAIHTLSGVQGLHSHCLFVYGSVFEILLDTTTVQPPGRVDEMIAVIMFNMALFFHVKGMPTNDLNALSRASRLYELVFKMTGNNTSSLGALLQIVTLNNLGALYFSIRRPQETSRCFTALFHLLQESAGGGTDVLSHQDQSEITNNCSFILCLQEQAFGACAEAA